MNSENDEKPGVPEHDKFFARLGIAAMAWGVAVAVAVLVAAVIQ